MVSFAHIRHLKYSCPMIHRSRVGMTIWLQHFHCSNSSTVCLKDCYRAPTIKNIYCSNKAEVFLVCSELSASVLIFYFHCPHICYFHLYFPISSIAFDPSLSSLGVGSEDLCKLGNVKALCFNSFSLLLSLSFSLSFLFRL